MSNEFDIESLKFNEDGLIPAIAQAVETGEVLMMAWMNRQTIEMTLQTGAVTYWSRSRQEVWEKGATSGNRQKLRSFRIDCDRDCILVLVDQDGPACHTNRRSCYYTEIQDGIEVELSQPM